VGYFPAPGVGVTQLATLSPAFLAGFAVRQAAERHPTGFIKAKPKNYAN
jgi:hypothetical protein